MRGALRAILRFLYDPRTMIAFLTLGPLLLVEFGFLIGWTAPLSKQVGVSSPVYLYYLLCTLAFALGYTGARAANSTRPTALARPYAPLMRVHRPHGTAVRQEYPIIAHDERFAKRLWLAAIAVTLVIAGTGILVVFSTVSDYYITDLATTLRLRLANPDLVFGPEGFSFSVTMPGVVRMLHFWVLAALVLWLSLRIAWPWVCRNRESLFLAYLVLLASIVFLRSVITGNRNPVLAVVVLVIYVFLVRGALPRLSVGKPHVNRRPYLGAIVTSAALVFSSLVALDLITVVRLGPGRGISPVLEYLDLGVANTALAVSTTTRHSFGFASILSPLVFAARGLGWQVQFPSSDREWILNPAGSLTTLSFADFGFWGALEYALLGVVVGYVHTRHLCNSHSVRWAASYLWALVALSTVWIVPLFAGPDYWAGVIGSVLGGSLLDTLHHRRRHAQRYSSATAMTAVARSPARGKVGP